METVPMLWASHPHRNSQEFSLKCDNCPIGPDATWLTTAEDSVRRSIPLCPKSAAARGMQPSRSRHHCHVLPPCPELGQTTSHARVQQANPSCCQDGLAKRCPRTPRPLLGVHGTDRCCCCCCASQSQAQPAARRHASAAAAGPLQPLASLMNPGHSAFSLQHFLELVLGK